MKFLILIFVFKIVIHLTKCQTNPTGVNLIKSISSQSYRTYNESCLGDYDRSCINNLECKKFECKCPSGKIWSNSIKRCLPYSQQSCNQSIECQDSDPNMVCSDYKCQCKSGYQIVGEKCYENSYISNRYGYCSYNYVCNTTLECIENQCYCPAETMWSSELGQCISISLGNCKSNLECQDRDIYMECFKTKCQCKDGYELNDLTKLCKKKKKLIGSSCFDNDECPSGSTCHDDVCTCKLFYEPSYDSSYCKLKSCFNDYDCPGLNSHCSYGTCSCKYGYKESISTSTCIRDYTIDLNSYGFDLTYLNFLWILVIIPFFVFFTRLCMCCRSSNRISQGHVINTPANNFNTISPSAPFVYNNPYPSSSTVQLSCTQPPFDSPPKYDQVVSMNQQRNN